MKTNEIRNANWFLRTAHKIKCAWMCLFASEFILIKLGKEDSDVNEVYYAGIYIDEIPLILDAESSIIQNRPEDF